MDMTSLLALKRDGGACPPGALARFAKGVADGSIPDYQASAFLMAAFIRGLSLEETVELTRGIRDSGRILAWPQDSRPVADKHSTGGVGDKISLVLAPLAAEMGLRVPMVSGRGLGHTGGTLDKLESIPGFRTRLEPDEFQDLVDRIGFAMCGQTDEIAPADRILYSLRDATSTVASMPLICASILGKKLSEGLDRLVLDVKAGRGAFMRTREDALALARMLVGVSTGCGTPARALVTDMDVVLGRTAGNALETAEALSVLRGGGPLVIRDLATRLTALMLQAPGDPADSLDDLQAECAARLDDSSALHRFERMVEAQGGDLSAFESLAPAPVILELKSDRSGYWTGVDAGVAGEVVRGLGGGRRRVEDEIRPEVGWEQAAESGFPVEDGQTIGWVHAAAPDDARSAAETLRGAFIWDRANNPLILEVL
ncbi:MAG TPA: thymidine phosphorylase [Candidatus Fermentibacter daniensis]|jgi:pyrimidine-nucleoside phosphorylase|nr:thymidine phosphorylase [Candidatus Fermentibacter daniensis]HOA05564.1 thymidine phosphorylase [Candidatus Fermentibacter daniensis]HOG54071.1 thymidine phosphorylase [Candidatus Fermentibacter daniensis]HPH40125.1 thymidine phosphorylase [Candidatus Fermentibacter daniensis]HPN63376.1 thymidine phosphorylase [Candidatus Fermentibacter daniensis]